MIHIVVICECWLCTDSIGGNPGQASVAASTHGAAPRGDTSAGQETDAGVSILVIWQLLA